MPDARFRVTVDTADLESAVNKAFSRVTRIGKRMEAARGPASRAMAELGREKMLANLRAPKGGEIWSADRLPQGWRWLLRPSGRSGGYPASQWGALAESIRIHDNPDGTADLVVGEGLERPYAYWLEYGFTTRFKKRHVRFPFIRRSVNEVPKVAYTDAAFNAIRKVGIE
jgi:hypothetical protein